MRRPSPGFMAVLYAVALAATLLVCVRPASATTITTQELRQRERDELVALNARTARCMHDAAIAGLRYAGPERAMVVRDFMLTMCAAPMRDFLVRTQGLPRQQADGLLRDLATQMLINQLN